MSRLARIIVAVVALLGVALPVHAATNYLNQTSWSNSNRRTQNLPTTSAWFASSLGSLTTSGGALVMFVGGSSGMAVTYFTPHSNSPPVQLNVGDTLTATFGLTFNGVSTNGSTSEGFRFGLFDFADGSNVPIRVTADGSFSSSSQGLGVQGYALFGKTYTTFIDDQPIDIRKRTSVSDGSLLGASGDWSTLAKDDLNTNAFDGFANLTNSYTLQFVLQRTNLTSLAITVTWSNLVTGAILSDSTTDVSATSFSFDGIAYRPSNNSEAPATNDFTRVTVQLTSSPIVPVIITQPQDQDLSSGDTATFTVVPNGTLPLFYQWYYNTNSPVASATNTTLVLTNVDIAAAGGYSVLISNSYGSVTSVVAALSVTNIAPFITSDLQDQTVIPGQNATFTVVADGSQPLSYQWYENTNTLLAGATGSSFTLTNVQPTDAGTYSVVVSNSVGTISSSNAVLTVNTNPVAPLFLTQPASVSVVVGGNTSFSATAIGTTPITYQWNQNGTPIAGETASNLYLTNVQFTNAATYTLVASNSIGSTTSSNAILTVLPNVPPLPVIPATNFLITSYGAVGDGVTDNSGSIQNTINAVAAAGGGTVEIPTNGALNTYMSGPIVLSNSVNLQVDGGAMLQMLPITRWPGTTTFISANGVHDIEISGAGTIDGNAWFGSTNWWGQNLSTAQRPDFINIQGSSSNILIQGVTLQNPPTFHMVLKGGNVNLTIQNLTVNTPGNSPNTDGMDLASTNVLIQGCSISDGDDNIEIGGSGAPAAGITVSNCTFGTGHGLSIGSITSGGVHDLLVSNCTFNGTENGIRMKSDRDIGGLVQNLRYLDLTMNNVGYPIVIWSFYDSVGSPNAITPSTAAANGPQQVITTTPFWQNILISNLTATADNGANVAGVIWGRQEAPVSNLTLCAVNIASHGRTFDVYNGQAIQILDSQLTTDGSTNTLTLYNAQVTVTNSAPNASPVTLDGLAIPPTNNVLAFFNTQAVITRTNLVGPDPLLTLGSSTFTVSNSLNLGCTSTLNFGVGSNAAVVAVAGNLSLGGTLNISDGGGFSNGTYTLFTYTGALIYNCVAIGATPNTNFTYTVSTNTVGQVNLIAALAVTPPVASFTASPTNGAAPLMVNFTDTSSNSPTSWAWTFGDGGTSTLQSPTYAYVSPGSYTASLVDSNAGGSSTNSATATITVYDPFAWWQQAYGLTGPLSGGNASYTGDGMSNTNKFLAGFNPTNAAAYLRVISIAEKLVAGNTNVIVTYLGANGDNTYAPGIASRTNVLDYLTGTANGSYTNGGWQDTGQTNILGGGNGSGIVTNMTDAAIPGATTNRYYRVRVLLP